MQFDSTLRQAHVCCPRRTGIISWDRLLPMRLVNTAVGKHGVSPTMGGGQPAICDLRQACESQILLRLVEAIFHMRVLTNMKSISRDLYRT